MDINKIDSLTMKITLKTRRARHPVQPMMFCQRLEKAARNNDEKELKACQEFEAIMLDMLYKQ